MIPDLSFEQSQRFGSKHVNVCLIFFLALFGLTNQYRSLSTQSLFDKARMTFNCSTVQDCIAALQEEKQMWKEKENAYNSALEDMKSLAMVNCSTLQDCIAALQKDTQLRKEKGKAYNSTLEVMKSLAMVNCSTVQDCIAALQKDTQLRKEKEKARNSTLEDDHQCIDLKSLFEGARQTFNCTTAQDCIAGLQEDAKIRKEKENAYKSVLQRVASLAVQRSKIPHNVSFPISNVNTKRILEPRTKTHGKPEALWNDALFPDFYIAGLPKTGSSHLHKILETHRDVRSLFRLQEVCSGHVDYIANSNFSNDQKQDVQRQLYGFHKKQFRYLKQVEQLYDVHPTSKAKYFNPSKYKTVGTCFRPKDIILRHNYLMTKKKTRIFFILRDPADWLWAAYNYWVRSGIMDSRTSAFNNWAHPKKEYRSPEHFHEIIAAGKKSSIGAHLLSWAEMTVQPIRYLKAAFGKDSVFVVRSEDMKPHNDFVDDGQQPGGGLSFFDKLVNFTGLPRDGFQNEVVNSIHNCNDKKGKTTTCSANTKKIGYAISGNRDMLSKTRKLIYLYFHEECKIWKEEFHVFYPECVDAL